MLHIKVLSYEEYDNTTLDNLDEKYFKLKKKEKTCTGFEDAEFLCDTHTVERRFIEILNTDFDAFRDEISCRLLKELDNSYRDNDYGIVTPMGKSCITCLSSEIKLALLIQYFSNRGTDIFVRFKIACKNIWIWLAKNADMTLYMREKDYRDVDDIRLFCYFLIGNNETEKTDELIDVEYHGNIIDVHFSAEAKKLRSFTKSFEYDIFTDMFGGKKLLFFRKTEKLTLGEFINSFDLEKEDIDELRYCKDVHYMDIYDYTVTVPGNYIYIDENTSLNNYMVIHYEESNLYEECTVFRCSEGKKSLFEVILWSALTFDYCQYHEITGLITDERMQNISEDYLACARWGYYINTENKEIVIYEAEQGVIRFHNAFIGVDEADEEY